MTSGSDSTKLAEQELSKEAVVAEPLAPAIERDEERVRSLEPAQLPLCARLSEHGLTQRSAQLIEHRRATKEPLIVLGQLAQRLAIQIVRDVPVVPRDRRCQAALVAGDESRQVQADRPAFGAFGHRRRLFARQRDVCAREDLFGSGRVESKVAHSDVERITRRSQARDVRLFGTARCDQLGAARNSRDHHAEHVVAGRRLKLVQVVQHHHEWRWAGLNAEARRGAARPNTDTPNPPTSAIRSAVVGEDAGVRRGQ